MTYTDTVARISEIQGQMAALRTAFEPPAPASTAAQSSAAASSGSSASTSTFASALARAQAPGETEDGAGTALGATGVPTPLVQGASSGGASLSAAAQGMLTTGQQQFASRLAADTGLSSQVIAAWLLAEESGGAATARQSANNNDWLNIGYTDSGTYGSADSIWSDPSTAADATAGWLKGQNTIPGYGTASAGIQAIPSTAGQSPAAQIAAIQQSGWASSGYPDLPALYQRVAG